MFTGTPHFFQKGVEFSWFLSEPDLIISGRSWDSATLVNKEEVIHETPSVLIGLHAQQTQYASTLIFRLDVFLARPYPCPSISSYIDEPKVYSYVAESNECKNYVNFLYAIRKATHTALLRKHYNKILFPKFCPQNMAVNFESVTVIENLNLKSAIREFECGEAVWCSCTWLFKADI